MYLQLHCPDADEGGATDRAAESPRPVLASAPSVRVRPGIRSLDACVAHYASENTFPLRIRHRPALLRLLLVVVVVVVSVSYLRNRRSPFRAKFEIGNKFGGADGLHATVSLVLFVYIPVFDLCRVKRETVLLLGFPPDVYVMSLAGRITLYPPGRPLCVQRRGDGAGGESMRAETDGRRLRGMCPACLTRFPCVRALWTTCERHLLVLYAPKASPPLFRCLAKYPPFWHSETF